MRIVFIAAITLTISGCATVFTGTKYTITFNSTPSGATIYLDGLELCRTPCTQKIKRSVNDTDVEFKLDGYQTRLITLDKEFNLVSVINLGNLLFWGIDVISGSVMKYDRKGYDITLTRNEKTSKINADKILIDSKANTVDVYVVN